MVGISFTSTHHSPSSISGIARTFTFDLDWWSMIFLSVSGTIWQDGINSVAMRVMRCCCHTPYMFPTGVHHNGLHYSHLNTLYHTSSSSGSSTTFDLGWNMEDNFWFIRLVWFVNMERFPLLQECCEIIVIPLTCLQQMWSPLVGPTSTSTIHSSIPR